VCVCGWVCGCATAVPAGMMTSTGAMAFMRAGAGTTKFFTLSRTVLYCRTARFKAKFKSSVSYFSLKS